MTNSEVWNWVPAIVSHRVDPLLTTPNISVNSSQNLGNVRKKSLHLELLTDLPRVSVDQDILDQMNLVRNIVTEGHAARKLANISLKQPLPKVTISGVKSLTSEYNDLVKQELNLKEVIIEAKSDSLTVALDTTLTPELIEEGKARELIRVIQAARKQAGTLIDEKVIVVLPDWPKAFEAEIMAKVKATQLVKGETLTIKRNVE